MRRFVFGLLLILSSSALTANDIDSLRIALDYQSEDGERLQTLYAISYTYLTQGDTTGISFWEESLQLAQQTENHQQVANLYYLKGYFERTFRANHTEAFVSFSLARELYKTLKDSKNQAAATLLIAEYHRNIGEYAQSEQLYREAEVLLLEINNLQEIGRLHEHLGFLAEEQGDLQKAEQEFTVATVYFNKSNSWPLLVSDLNDLGRIQYQQGKLQEAKLTLQRVQEKAQLHDITLIDQTYAAFNLARIYWKEGDLEKAHRELAAAYQSAFEIQPGHTETFRMASLLADFYQETEQPTKALAVLVAQADYMPPSPNETQLSVYTQLVALYRETDQWEKALAYSDKLNAGQMALANAEAQANQARQTSEILLAQKILADREEVNDYQLAETRWLWTCLALTLVLLAAFGLMYRLKEKHRKKALDNATHWPELNKRFQALEDALNVLY
ncbi:MAG: hypothetical protein AAFQ98_03310 [Bacteroidota bacterium]